MTQNGPQQPTAIQSKVYSDPQLLKTIHKNPQPDKTILKKVHNVSLRPTTIHKNPIHPTNTLEIIQNSPKQLATSQNIQQQPLTTRCCQLFLQ